MTFAEMKLRVKAYSGEQDNTRLGYAVNDALNLIYNALRWPFLKVLGTAIVLVAGTQRYALPSNFKYPSSFWYRNTTVGTPTFLKSTVRVLDSVAIGIPSRYRITKAAAASGSPVTKAAWYVEFEYIPASSFVAQYPTMEYEHYYKPADLSNDNDVPQLDEADHQIVVCGAVNMLTSKQGDAGAFQMFAQQWKLGFADIIQNAIDLYGQNVVVPPGTDITEQETITYSDYGRMR